jgi:hypothetical protein
MRFRPGAQPKRIGLGLVVTVVSTAGCAPAPERAHHTVEEYRNDRTLLSAELAECANDPGTLGHSADCVNAREAARARYVGSLRNLAPLRVPRKP